MMKLSATLLAVVFLTLSTGCFEVVEEISILDGRKGKGALTINLSQAKTRLSSILLMDSINGQRVPSEQEIKSKLAQIRNIAEKTPGMHNVALESDFDNFVFSLQCDFDSVECINHFVHNVEQQHIVLKNNKVIPKQLFSYSGNRYFRNSDY